MVFYTYTFIRAIYRIMYIFIDVNIHFRYSFGVLQNSITRNFDYKIVNM